MRLVHLTSSTFFGGPERQMLGLAEALRGRCEVGFLSFAEHGKCAAFLAEVKRCGFEGQQLHHDTPHLWAAFDDLCGLLKHALPSVLLCHGYKADLLGRRAARHVGIPVISVSRGWTAESLRVRLYEALDRRDLPGMDHVVAVSSEQAKLVIAAGVPSERVSVIHNSARVGAFAPPSPEGRARLASNASSPGDYYVVTAARLSPEKGVHVLIDSARRVIDALPGARFLIFGEGPERDRLESIIAEVDIGHAVTLPGFHTQLDQILSNADLAVLPSYHEGLPNVVLEASAAGVPVVATSVGGTPEAIADGETGCLVPAGDPFAMSHAVTTLLCDPVKRARMGATGREFVRTEFSFPRQAQAYLDLFARLSSVQSKGDRRAA